VTLDEIRAMGLRLAELCQKYGIAELSVFGSIARGDERADSDVDLLYVRLPGNDLGMSYFALQEDPAHPRPGPGRRAGSVCSVMPSTSPTL
jgi:predicted nucleotidyltransferase